MWKWKVRPFVRCVRFFVSDMNDWPAGPSIKLGGTKVVCLFVCFSLSSIVQNIRGSPWSHNWAHSSPTRN